MSSAGLSSHDQSHNKDVKNDCNIGEDLVAFVLHSSNGHKTQQFQSPASDHINNFDVCNSSNVNTAARTTVGLNENSNVTTSHNESSVTCQNGNSTSVIVTLSNLSANNAADVNSTLQQPPSIIWAPTQSAFEPQFVSPVNLTSLAAAVTDLVTVFPQNFQAIDPNVLRASIQNVRSSDSFTVSTGTKSEKRKCITKRKRFQQFDLNADDEDDDDGNSPTNGKQQKIMSPFAPEATVPLPFQLSDFGNLRSLGTTIWKRNERERYRVRCVNEGYERLRNHLPVPEHEKRLSKVDTLRLAIYYIHHLQFMLYEDGHASRCKCFSNFNSERQETLMQNNNSSDPSSAD